MSAPHVAAQSSKHMPGEPGIWLFIFGDMIVFTLLFGCFAHYRSQAIGVFLAGQSHLDQRLGILNTVLLLCSSWFVVTAVRVARDHRAKDASMLLAGALLCGGGFMATKYVEYSAHIANGLTLVSDDFFMFYYMLTGIHLLHVTIGMAVLIFFAKSAWKEDLTALQLRNLECGASFWHLVDLLWIVLFALLYLIP